MVDFQSVQSATSTHYTQNNSTIYSTLAPQKIYRKAIHFQNIDNITAINFDKVVDKSLNVSLMGTVHYEDGEYVAELLDMPLFSVGKSKKKAIKNLQYELDTLYTELMEDDNFSEEFLTYKDFFLKNIQE
jgi:predicted RNase H-like HicB family nuclease